ncbi:Predicted homoserine dehydrogenase, contains C-terminal SAF domain [Lentibacillus persicus]|uniref:Predicted homoserine dehydrogenase, contains C-terminal SAF domain n=1 Tax=Lentibacillus persicus TaxID=640948 RepID=A0A1I1UB05_9BACI|nr:NAD(P)-dependent oxidoreductase [Lentibacillus persicus]SFD66758.1 Predicted homoserine dehydrogenase, contains C-terminal SAF domain [Lentibacillus persicus]
MTRIGIAGTGFIGKGIAIEVNRQPELQLTAVLTRRDISKMGDYPFCEALTNSTREFIATCDMVVECSGDIIYGSEVIDQAIKAGKPVVTMNAELQVTTGSYFAKRGFITEAEGDQPGCLASLHENVVDMGFKPLVYGNIKGFMKLDPVLEDMQYWSQRNGVRLDMTTSFTDGTKVQVEQALVANGLGAGIAKDGLLAPESEDINKTGAELAKVADRLGCPISDFVVSPKGPPGVFITAEHDKRHEEALKYYKMGNGPYYTILQNYHLCHLEVIKTIKRVASGGGVLLNNGKEPTVSVAAIPKRALQPGEIIDKGIGSFQVRGEAVEISGNENHVPIGLLVNALITNKVKEGEIITFDDVELPESLAFKAWQETIEKAPINI